MTDPIRFTVSPQGDGGDVRAILAAHMNYEQTKSVRLFWVHVLAALGGLLAFCVVFPRVGAAYLPGIVLTAWCTCALGVVIAAIAERQWQRREADLLIRAAPQSNPVP